MRAGIPGRLGRDLGFSEAGGTLPDPTVEVVALLTQLGDTWLLFVVLGLFYLFGPDRRRGALAVALAIGGLGVVVALKHWFALPRPPAALYHADGYGFPSGHAVGATVVWGSLAVLADRWTRRRRVLVAATIVLAVSASRVLLGVHYAGDVLVGAAVGLAFLAGVLWVARGEPTRAFAVAGVVALLAVGVGGGVDAAGALGAAIGAGLAWVGLDPDGRAVSVPVAVLGCGVLGSLWLVVLVVEPPLPVVFVANVVTVGGIVGLPRANGAVESRLPRPVQNFSR